MRARAEAFPSASIARLRWENRYNRFAGVFNWLLRRSSQLVTGQTEALMQMVNDIAFSYRTFLYPTSRERKIRALSDRMMIEHPESADSRRAAERAAGIDRKIERDRRRDFERRCRLALQLEQWESAEALARSALTLWPSDEGFEKHLRAADHEIALRHRRWQRSLQVDSLGEAMMDEEDWQPMGELIRAWLQGRGAMTAVETKPQLRDHVELMRATALANSGDVDDAGATLDWLARGDGPLAWRAGQLRSRRPLNPEREVEDALRRRRSLTRRHIWQGGRDVEDNLHMASSSAISDGLVAPVALGAFFFVDSTIRAVALQFKNPLAARAVIDALTAKGRREGQMEVAQITLLRDLERDVGRPQRALEAHDRIPDASPRLRRRLVEQVARSRVQAADAIEDDLLRERVLASVVESMPETRAAKEAWETLHGETWPGVRLTSDQIRAHGLALATAGFPVPEALWDGDDKNGEIEREGVWIAEDGGVRYRVEGERVWQTAQSAGEDAARLWGAVEMIAESSDRTEGIQGRQRPRIPLEVTGSVGAAGAYAAPQLQQFRELDPDLALYE